MEKFVDKVEPISPKIKTILTAADLGNNSKPRGL